MHFMQINPQACNKYFNHVNISTYFKEYITTLYSALYKLNLEAAQRTILNRRGRIFVGGNGGSSAISDHLTCDFEKGTGLQTQSLVGRVALLTAIANDMGYEKVFSHQLELAKINRGDLIILISSSGNSPNIVAAAEYAKSIGTPIIGLSGFTGGALASLSDVSLHVDVKNYGVVEDAHQTIMHVLAQYIYLEKP